MHRVVTTAALVLVVALVASACWSRSKDNGAPAASSGEGTSPTPERDIAPATGLKGRIVYSSVQGDLWVVAADGSDRRRLTDSGAGIDYSPTWSPDGKRIAFRTTRGSPSGPDPSNIFIINTDGSGQRQLTPPRGAVAGGLFPAWSPDGSRTGDRFGVNLSSAVSAKGKLRFAAYDGNLNGPVFIDFCRRLLCDTPGPVFLVLDGHPVHRSNAVKAFAASIGGRLRLCFLPGYAPELNPDEWVWKHVKHDRIGRAGVTAPEDLKAKALAALHRLQKLPHLVRSFFRDPNLSYITA